MSLSIVQKQNTESMDVNTLLPVAHNGLHCFLFPFSGMLANGINAGAGTALIVTGLCI